VAIYVLEGNGILETDDQSIVVMPDVCITISAGVNRGIRNTTAGEIRLLVVKIFG